jgi:hypothetical protein
MINQDENAAKEAALNAKSANAGLENFDWESYAEDAIYSKDQRNELENMYNQTLSTIGENEVLRVPLLYDQA